MGNLLLLFTAATKPRAFLIIRLIQHSLVLLLFPVPIDVSHEVDGKVNLDISHSDGLRMTDANNTYAPDVLIVPSKLKEFSKVNGTFDLCNLNPSYINKVKYAELHVSSGEMPGKDRVGVTLVKLEV
ncbi:hypothetical protein F5887DRAFT_944941 [Amanita rubescens]|nr:hypothetical protein F5887DRAFT_944941 [Amanita rubescens]